MGNDTESKEGSVTIKFIHIFFSSYNSDGLSLMDVAVLTNNTEMVKLLIQHGAREGTECKFLVSLLFIYRWRTFFLLFCWLLLFSFVRGNQMAARNRWICIWFNCSTKPKNSWKRRVSRRPVRFVWIWTNTSHCGNGECAFCVKWNRDSNSWVSPIQYSLIIISLNFDIENVVVVVVVPIYWFDSVR